MGDDLDFLRSSCTRVPLAHADRSKRLDIPREVIDNYSASDRAIYGVAEPTEERQVLEPDELGRMLDAAGQSLLWNPDLLAEFERRDMVLVPAGYYYPVPTREEAAHTFEANEPLPYDNPDVFDRKLLREELLRLLPYSAEFDPPRHSDNASLYAWDSGMFGFSDAMAYYTMIRSRKPGVVVEIGSGSSTLVALQALRRNGKGRLICVEPNPSDFLLNLDIDLVESPAQDLPAGWFEDRLPDESILFIDSTHALKVGSDCLHLYLRVLPVLRTRLFVHVHDFGLPCGTPQDWIERRVFWTEQYLVFAYLLRNSQACVLYGSVANEIWHPDLMRELMHGKAPVGGGSLWFEQATD